MSDSSSFFSSNPEKRTVDENWDMFKTSLTTGMSQFIPQKSSRPKYKLPWINANIKREMRKKDRMHKRAINTKNHQHWETFKRQRNLVSKLIKDSHSDYLNNIVGHSLKDNPKKFWSYVRNSKSESIGIPPLKNNDSSISVTDKDKAETLNDYFHSVFTQEQLPIPDLGKSPYSSVPDLNISPEGVYKQLSELNPKKACRPDEIPCKSPERSFTINIKLASIHFSTIF